MMKIEIPGYRAINAEHLVLDFSQVICNRITDALSLLLNPDRLVATLRN